MSKLRFIKHIEQIIEDEEQPAKESNYLDEFPSQYQLGTSFSYYESIHEFNQIRYGGASYSIYQIGKHIINLIFNCRLFHWYKNI